MFCILNYRNKTVKNICYIQEVLGNFMREQGAKSASPTVAEYKGLLRETLASASKHLIYFTYN